MRIELSSMTIWNENCIGGKPRGHSREAPADGLVSASLPASAYRAIQTDCSIDGCNFRAAKARPRVREPSLAIEATVVHMSSDHMTSSSKRFFFKLKCQGRRGSNSGPRISQLERGMS